MTLWILLVLVGAEVAPQTVALRPSWRARFPSASASSDRHLIFDQPTVIILKDPTLSDTVGLEADEVLTRLTISVHFVPCHIQFHRSPTSGVHSASTPVDAPP
jgi:hypothetical protein